MIMRILFISLALMVPAGWVCAESPVVRPYEAEAGFVAQNRIDECVLKQLGTKGIEPANRCSDVVFVRRAYLDVIGTLPGPWQVQAFLKDQRPDKRSRLIDDLLERDEFADYWSLKWCDLLRVKSEFPINLWPNAVQAYHRWIYQSVRDKMPCDQFARELLTSSGSNFRVPQVNFYRAVQGREPSSLARAVALTFMGVRVENWPEERRADLEEFFSRVAYKPTKEWKEEIVFLAPEAAESMKVVFPDGSKALVGAGQDPRHVFADWLVAPDNPWFARNIANPAWYWLMGRGIVHEPDDIRPDNPPVNGELLAYLEKELVESGYDWKHLFRVILNSATYQQSSIARSENPGAADLFACYRIRRLDAEVLMDAICGITWTGQGYSSPIPEPFTFVPESQRAISLADGSITSPFLELFGRPSRDTGLESERSTQFTEAQRLYLFNSSDLQGRIVRSSRLGQSLRAAKGDSVELVRNAYLTILSRYPTDDELKVGKDYLDGKGIRLKSAQEDLVWALINTKEFLYRH